MSFKLVEIVGAEIFDRLMCLCMELEHRHKRLEYRCARNKLRLLNIRFLASERCVGYRSVIYNIPNYGNVKIDSGNNTDITIDLSKALPYLNDNL